MTEEEYDQNVAPLMLKAARLAEELGGTLLCFAEYGDRLEDGTRDNGRTKIMTDPTALAQLVDRAMRSRGNLDALALGLVAAHEAGILNLSGTIFLQRMSK